MLDIRSMNVIAGWSLAICLSGLLSQPAIAQHIQWRNVAAAEQDAKAEAAVMTPLAAAAAMRDIVGEKSAARVVVQFSSPMSPGDRSQLRSAGVEILAPLGSNA